jgi:repressor LexA
MVSLPRVPFVTQAYNTEKSKSCQSLCSVKMKSSSESPFGKRLREIFKGANNTEIASILDTSKSNVTEYIQGRIPPSDTLLRISEITKCDLHWLMTGEIRKETAKPQKEDEHFVPVYFEEGVERLIGTLAREEKTDISEMVRDLAIEGLALRGRIKTRSYDRLSYINLGEREQKFITVRLLGEIAAGKPIRAFEQFENVQVPEEFIKKGRETYALRVRGDSMVDEGIFDGDLLICVEAKDPFPGETVVALIDGEEATVKRFYQRGNQVRLEPANPDYEPLVLKADRVQIQGVVTGIYRKR